MDNTGRDHNFLGSKIALISKAEIRYEGVLYTVDSNEGTVALAKVKSHGTEDRPTDRPVPPRDEIFEYIIFRGSDIKNLIVLEPPAGSSSWVQDPAIVSSSMRDHGVPVRTNRSPSLFNVTHYRDFHDFDSYTPRSFSQPTRGHFRPATPFFGPRASSYNSRQQGRGSPGYRSHSLQASEFNRRSSPRSYSSEAGQPIYNNWRLDSRDYSSGGFSGRERLRGGSYDAGEGRRNFGSRDTRSTGNWRGSERGEKERERDGSKQAARDGEGEVIGDEGASGVLEKKEKSVENECKNDTGVDNDNDMKESVKVEESRERKEELSLDLTDLTDVSEEISVAKQSTVLDGGEKSREKERGGETGEEQKSGKVAKETLPSLGTGANAGEKRTGEEKNREKEGRDKRSGGEGSGRYVAGERREGHLSNRASYGGSYVSFTDPGNRNSGYRKFDLGDSYGRNTGGEFGGFQRNNHFSPRNFYNGDYCKRNLSYFPNGYDRGHQYGYHSQYDYDRSRFAAGDRSHSQPSEKSSRYVDHRYYDRERGSYDFPASSYGRRPLQQVASRENGRNGNVAANHQRSSWQKSNGERVTDYREKEKVDGGVKNRRGNNGEKVGEEDRDRKDAERKETGEESRERGKESGVGKRSEKKVHYEDDDEMARGDAERRKPERKGKDSSRIRSSHNEHRRMENGRDRSGAATKVRNVQVSGTGKPRAKSASNSTDGGSRKQPPIGRRSESASHRGISGTGRANSESGKAASSAASNSCKIEKGKGGRVLKFAEDYDFEKALIQFRDLMEKEHQEKVTSASDDGVDRDEIRGNSSVPKIVVTACSDCPEVDQNGDNDSGNKMAAGLTENKMSDSGEETTGEIADKVQKKRVPPEGRNENELPVSYYDRSLSFFDRVGCGSGSGSDFGDKAAARRSYWKAEKKLNVETFGTAVVARKNVTRRTFRRGYRARGDGNKENEATGKQD